jgi:hypothetical protein
MALPRVASAALVRRRGDDRGLERRWLVTLPPDDVLARLQAAVETHRARATGGRWRLRSHERDGGSAFVLEDDDDAFADAHDRSRSFALRGLLERHPIGTMVTAELKLVPPSGRKRTAFWGLWASCFALFVLAPLLWIPQWVHGVFGSEVAVLLAGAVACTVMPLRRPRAGARELVALDLVHSAIADRIEPRPQRLSLRAPGRARRSRRASGSCPRALVLCARSPVRRLRPRRRGAALADRDVAGDGPRRVHRVRP